MLHLVDHPLITEELTKLRNPACPPPEFRQSSRRIAALMVPEGVSALEEAYPDIAIYAACLDRCLDNLGYILPGLGDAGDRLGAASG